jgi:hypothetical protein
MNNRVVQKPQFLNNHLKPAPLPNEGKKNYHEGAEGEKGIKSLLPSSPFSPLWFYSLYLGNSRGSFRKPVFTLTGG